MQKRFRDLSRDAGCHGRGASSNAAGRYERLASEAVEDGWEQEAPSPRPTEVRIDATRSIIARNNSPDVPFERSINPYRGCEHGCIYCFARPTHAHLGLSPGLDFETRIIVKPKAAELLEAALARPRYRVQTIAIGTNTDPYQPLEREHRVMRRVLEVLAAHHHPVSITTKGSLVTRDLDLLAAMGGEGTAHVTVSLTTLNHRLGRAMEPRAASPKRRLAMIRELASAGVPVGVNISPVVPALTDHELERLIEVAAAAGATSAAWSMLRLPLEVAGLFREWLERYCPDGARRVMGRVRETHGGRDYDPEWGRRMKGEGPHAAMVAQRFRAAVRRHGLDRPHPRLRTDLFAVPARNVAQLSLDL